MASSLIIGILFIITLGNLIFLWLLYRDLLRKMKDYDKQLFELRTDTDITEAFSDDESHEDLNKLANELLVRVKQTFGLEGNTFSEFVTLLKNKSVKNEKLKETLIHFYEKIIVFSYRDIEISDANRDELKQEYKLIVRLINEHTSEMKKKSRR